jgi:NAD(P)H-hydrate epimerase
MSADPKGLLMSIPALTREQMAEVDRSMVEDFGIDMLQMMESAGRHLAHLARDRFLAGDARDKGVLVLAGAGGNGAGALVAARRLFNWGAKVDVFLLRTRDQYKGVPGVQLSQCERVKIPLRAPDVPITTDDAHVVLDGMVGYGLRGKPKDGVADGIRWANAQPVPVLSLDLPSGMDATSGAMPMPALKSTATLALALPKTGLVAHGAEEFRGELYLGDIGVPELAFRRVGIRVGPIFSENDLLRLA